MKKRLIVTKKLNKRIGPTEEILEEEKEKKQQKQPQNIRKITIFDNLNKNTKRNRG